MIDQDAHRRPVERPSGKYAVMRHEANARSFDIRTNVLELPYKRE